VWGSITGSGLDGFPGWDGRCSVDDCRCACVHTEMADLSDRAGAKRSPDEPRGIGRRRLVPRQADEAVTLRDEHALQRGAGRRGPAPGPRAPGPRPRRHARTLLLSWRASGPAPSVSAPAADVQASGPAGSRTSREDRVGRDLAGLPGRGAQPPGRRRAHPGDLHRAGGAAARPLAHRTRRTAATLAGRPRLVSDQASAR
jgi:hypothetical protein